VQRTIDVCHKLKKHFNNQDVKLVLNAGGWNISGFLSKNEKDEKYELVAASIKALNLKGIILCIQTMPPFPWHFGGQSYHNLFVDPREIKEFLSIHGSPNIAVCLDVSHSLMASNYYGFDFYTDIGLYAEHIKHLHISDAEGSTGEGVEFGKGLLDIPRLAKEFDLYNINASFIPEVWQGHKDNGAGFWRALKALEGKV
jgi:N-acetylneuraminate synthase